MSKEKTNKELVKELPKVLKSAYEKLPNTPPEDAPKCMLNMFNGERDGEFTIEANENDNLEIAEWVFSRNGDTIPDMLDGEKDYLSKVISLANLAFFKMFGFFYENGNVKPCPLYSENENVKPLGISAKRKINSEILNLDDSTEKGLVFAKAFGIEDEYQEASKWEQTLFYIYCRDNKPTNTKVGKN